MIKLLWFFANVGVTSTVTLAAIPILIGEYGADQWAVLVVGQSAGGLIAVLVSFGWGVVGPADVAAIEGIAARRAYYRASFAPRAVLLAAGTPIMFTVAVVVGGSSAQMAAVLLSGLTPMFVAMGGSWFWVGCGRPAGLLTFDTLPRNIGAVFGLGACLSGGELWAYPLGSCLGALMAGGLALLLNSGEGGRGKPANSWVGTLRSHRYAAATAITAGLYINIPVIVVSFASPTAVPTYALADKLRGYAQMASLPLTQVMQGYVPATRERQELLRRIRKTRLIAYVAAATVSVGFAALAPRVDHIISAGGVELPQWLALVAGLTFGAVVVSGIQGPVHMVALSLHRQLASTTILGAAVGVGGSILLGLWLGIFGVAVSVLVAELLVSCSQRIFVSRATRGRSTCGHYETHQGQQGCQVS